MLTLSLALAILAGILNGSYAMPLKHMALPHNKVWLYFSVLTFLIGPWVMVYVMDPNLLPLLHQLPASDIKLLLLGGFLFGIGMLLFTLSLHFVGIGVSFLLNVSAGTIIGSVLPVMLLQPEKLTSFVGLLQIAALVIFFGGIVFTALASKTREENVSHASKFKGKNAIGLLLGSLSGLFTSAQGFTYSYTLPSIEHLAIFKSHVLLASSLPWVFIFNAAFIPYFLFFLVKSLQHKPSQPLNKSKTDVLYLLVMAVCYIGSIILFSKAGTLLGDMGSVIAWPIFMIAIILTSNVWGGIQKEWRYAGKHAIRFELVSIALLVIAVVLLALDGYLNLGH